MASLITHVVHGRKIFDRIPAKLDWDDFVVGTSFPDIRYLAHIDRNITHVYGTSEEKIPLDSSFKAGIYTHCLVDERRNELLEELGMFKIFSHDYINATALKLHEDAVMYTQFNDWKATAAAFEKAPPEQFEYNISPEDIKKWNFWNKTYISSAPTPDGWNKLFTTLGFPQEKIDAIITRAVEFSKNEEIKKILLNVYEKI